jgi:hypothetical protein
MTISIVAVDSVAGSGVITFDIVTDAGGCDENFSTFIEGQKFATHATRTGAGSSDESIAHTKAGLHTITILAESSNVSSLPVALNL